MQPAVQDIHSKQYHVTPHHTKDTSTQTAPEYMHSDQPATAVPDVVFKPSTLAGMVADVA